MDKMEGAELIMEDGVYKVIVKGDQEDQPMPNMFEYASDLSQLMQQSFLNSNKQFCHQRLRQLGLKMEVHMTYNKDNEIEQQKNKMFRDFSTIRKVDTHIHHSACMKAGHLLNFMKKKIRTEKDVEVY